MLNHVKPVLGRPGAMERGQPDLIPLRSVLRPEEMVTLVEPRKGVRFAIKCGKKIIYGSEAHPKNHDEPVEVVAERRTGVMVMGSVEKGC